MCSTASRRRRSIRGCSTRASMEIFGAKTPFYGWHYPPFFLAVAAALALMPYQLALIVWQGVTLLLYLFAIRAIVASPTASLAGPRLARATRRGGERCGSSSRSPIPAVFVNLGHGHNGFLTAALMGFALVHARHAADPCRRPVRAARLQAAIRADDPAGAGRRPGAGARIRGAARPSLRSVDRRNARIRHGDLARVLRVRRLHPRDRARGRRDRLAQDPERVLVGAHVGRRRSRSPTRSRERSRSRSRRP